MATGIYMLFFRNVYFLKAIVHCYLNYSVFRQIHWKETHSLHWACQRQKKIQKDFSDWLSASLLKQNKMKKNIASDVKSSFSNDTQTDGEIMAHFHQTAILSTTVPISSNWVSSFSRLLSVHKKHAHNFKFSFN